jgi:probable HAF family extracellular repeat protein
MASNITVEVPDSTLSANFSINDVGQIVGFYVDQDGRQHGFLATPKR